MKPKKEVFVIGLCTLTAFFVVCATNLFAGEVADKSTIIGTVYAVAWDNSDNVTAAVITTSSGEEYAIADDAIGHELFKLDNEVVKASGVFSEDGEGNKKFSVTNYEIMPE